LLKFLLWVDDYDHETAKQVINTAHILQFTLFPQPGEYPVILHLIGGIVPSFQGPGEVLYAHGYIPESVAKYISDHPKGLPVTIAASKAYSYYCGYTPFSHGITFRSAVINGTARAIDYDVAASCKEQVMEDDIKHHEKVWALHEIVNGILPGEWGHTRAPYKDEEVKRVHLLRVDIDTQASRVHKRLGILGYEADWEQATGDQYWEGAIPLWETYGDRINGNTTKNYPDHLSKLFADRQRNNKKVAEDEAKEPYKP
jgi:uncharacterized protein